MENNQPLMSFSENAGSAAHEQDVIQKLSLLYAENAKVAATFWEWRHKVMNRFFTESAEPLDVGAFHGATRCLAACG